MLFRSTISSSRNFVRPQPRHPLNRPATLWLNENAKENNPSPPLIHSNNQIIASRAALSPKIHRDIIPQPDSAHRPLRPPLGNVTNSSAHSGVLAPTGRSVREECTMKAAPPGVPHSRGELSELANFLKSTGPEDFTCRDPRIGTPGPGASMVFVDVPIKEDQSTSKALVDSVNRESLANRRKNTGRWLKKAVGMLWGGPSKGEFKEEPASAQISLRCLHWTDASCSGRKNRENYQYLPWCLKLLIRKYRPVSLGKLPLRCLVVMPQSDN